ncbi:hypothetical protein SAMN05216316_0841 [Nitrosovibrio sp. Nv6]|nr:hypothetical protein SAMN05216316_0841 [Nitrosovibrio sp. Nv6]
MRILLLQGSFRQVSLADTSVLDVLHLEGDELLINLSTKSISCWQDLSTPNPEESLLE